MLGVSPSAHGSHMPDSCLPEVLTASIAFVLTRRVVHSVRLGGDIRSGRLSEDPLLEIVPSESVA